MSFKEILIFVAEHNTLDYYRDYKCIVTKVPSIYPDEIFIITTSTGRKRIEDTLLKQGVLKGLIREYSLPDIRLTEDPLLCQGYDRQRD